MFYRLSLGQETNRFGHVGRVMHWQRWKDLEGGKELGVWLLIDESGRIEQELDVESHTYRGGDYDVYTVIPDGEWEHEGSFEAPVEAFERAKEVIEASGYPCEERTH